MRGLTSAIAIFLSAYLLFGVQPMMARYILPWFGGGPGTWTACVFFFQAILVLGYAYAHVLTTRLSPSAQRRTHMGLLLGSLALLPIAPGDAWKPVGGNDPTLHIVLLLAATVGPPYFLLTTTAPLLQRWLTSEHSTHAPYRLYALSNAGSLLGLLAYPFVLEPNLRLGTQTMLWSGMYVTFALLTVGIARGKADDPGVADPPLAERLASSTIGRERRALWLLLPACASMMLLATTNQICQDVAAVPFLWVLPLVLYLVSFIVTFEGDRWYDRRIWLPALVVGLGTCLWMLNASSKTALSTQVVAYLTTLLASCMVCHGELVRRRPDARHLTLFYLLVALGGALGGGFVGIVAPRIFDGYWELHLGLLGTYGLAAYCIINDRERPRGTRPRLLERPLPWAFGLVPLVFGLGLHIHEHFDETVAVSRSFYGVLRVAESHIDSPRRWKRKLYHGQIRHGDQFMAANRRRIPTSYYTKKSGIRAALAFHPRRKSGLRQPLHVGVLGLGTGTLAALARPGDRMRFYEIDAKAVRLSRAYFSYLTDSKATIDVILGDGRLSLERELADGSHQFDVLALDAFSGDAIPMHLLTIEAMEIYWAHLAPDGILAIHISNIHLELAPLVRGLAEHAGKHALYIKSRRDRRVSGRSATWVLLTNNRRFMEDRRVTTLARAWPEEAEPPIVWTDDFSNLLQVLE